MRSHCTYRGCTSWKGGIWEPVLLLWPEVQTIYQLQPVSVNVLGHALCDECIKKAKPVDFVPAVSDWMRIHNHLKANKLPPHSIKTAKLTFIIPETRLIGGEIA